MKHLDSGSGETPGRKSDGWMLKRSLFRRTPESEIIWPAAGSFGCHATTKFAVGNLGVL